MFLEAWLQPDLQFAVYRPISQQCACSHLTQSRPGTRSLPRFQLNRRSGSRLLLPPRFQPAVTQLLGTCAGGETMCPHTQAVDCIEYAGSTGLVAQRHSNKGQYIKVMTWKHIPLSCPKQWQCRGYQIVKKNEKKFCLKSIFFQSFKKYFKPFSAIWDHC